MKSSGPRPASALASAQFRVTRESSTLRRQSSMARRSISTSARCGPWASAVFYGRGCRCRSRNRRPCRKFRQMAQQQGAAGIDSVPGEDARLGPQPERLQKQRRAGLQRRVDGGGVAGRGGGANAVVTLGGFDAGAASSASSLARRPPPLSLGAMTSKGAPGASARRARASVRRRSIAPGGANMARFCNEPAGAASRASAPGHKGENWRASAAMAASSDGGAPNRFVKVIESPNVAPMFPKKFCARKAKKGRAPPRPPGPRRLL